MASLTPATEYRAVDLIVRSRKSLAPLLQAWPWAQTPGRVGREAPRWLVVTPQGLPKTADKAILEFAAMVEALPRSARRCWNEASSRVLDIGIQASLNPPSFEDVNLREATLQAMARIRAQMLVTIYAPSTDHG